MKIVSYLLSIIYWEHEWKWSCWNRRWANIRSKSGVQLPWTTSSPSVKGDYHVLSNTGWVRYGAVVCRIINWKRLKAYNVRSSLNIWTKFGNDFPGPFLVDPPQEKIVSHLFSILLSGGSGEGGGGGSTEMLLWIVNIQHITVHYSDQIMNCKLWIVNWKTDYSLLFGPNNES